MIISTTSRNVGTVIILLVISILLNLYHFILTPVNPVITTCAQSLSSDTNISQPSKITFVNPALTHIVIPFVHEQIIRVEHNLAKWKNFTPPCNNSYITMNYPPVKVVFQISYPTSLSSNILNETIHRCLVAFQNINNFPCIQRNPIIFAKPLTQTDNSHVEGARVLFEDFLLGNVLRNNDDNNNNNNNNTNDAQYALYMEPDMTPIREDWLTLISKETNYPVPKFWIKGSLFMGDLKAYDRTSYYALYFHMNGNAIYSLNSGKFRSFYFDQVRPYIVKKNVRSISAYDVDIFEYLTDSKNYAISRNIASKFVYTDSILNLWHTNYSITQVLTDYPNAVLIHGGEQIDVSQ
jgi:hypothetical protein